MHLCVCGVCACACALICFCVFCVLYVAVFALLCFCVPVRDFLVSMVCFTSSINISLTGHHLNNQGGIGKTGLIKGLNCAEFLFYYLLKQTSGSLLCGFDAVKGTWVSVGLAQLPSSPVNEALPAAPAGCWALASCSASVV